jgi:hypothetical protein
MTGTIIEKNGTVTDVDGVFGKYLYGSKQYYGKQLADLLSLARQMQERGRISYIKEFDESTGLPVAISSEPNPKYHNAVFYVSPSVKETGVVVRGIHHSVGEPCAKYDFAILPLDYRDIMLGHRTVSDTNRAKLGMVTGIAGALIYELADKTIRGRISTKQAVKRIASYVSDKKMSRRAFNSALALFSFYLAGCGGEGSTNPSPPPPPPPPPQTFTYSGSVLKRIANDSSKIGQGSVRLEGTPGMFTGNIDSAGNFSITGVKSGTYKRTTSDGAGDSVYVPQVESVVQINGNLTGQDYSVIERGPNRFGQEFNQLFQDFYSKIGLGLTGFLGLFKWGNLAGQEPLKIRSAASTIPDNLETRVMNDINFVNNRDTPTFSGGRIVFLPVEFGETASDYEIEMSMMNEPGYRTNFPLTDGTRIIRARALFNSFADIWIISHEYGHCYGAADFEDDNFISVMDSRTPRNNPTINDMLAFYLFNHPDVKPGNKAPDTNP